MATNKLEHDARQKRGLLSLLKEPLEKKWNTHISVVRVMRHGSWWFGGKQQSRGRKPGGFAGCVRGPEKGEGLLVQVMLDQPTYMRGLRDVARDTYAGEQKEKNEGE